MKFYETYVGTLIRTLKADINIRIYNKQQEMLFNGKVYHLYDHKEYDLYYIEKLLISLDSVDIVIAE
jgi:hypothetical protein